LSIESVQQRDLRIRSLIMLWTIAVILLLLWAVGMVSSYTLGGFIHLLLLLAIIVVLIRVIQGRSPAL
jgi:Zn-dependent protease with chaperone function